MEKTLNLNEINFNTGIKNILNSAFHYFLYSFSQKKTYYRLINLKKKFNLSQSCIMFDSLFSYCGKNAT